jgi:hypothetical protein
MLFGIALLSVAALASAQLECAAIEGVYQFTMDGFGGSVSIFGLGGLAGLGLLDVEDDCSYRFKYTLLEGDSSGNDCELYEGTVSPTEADEETWTLSDINLVFAVQRFSRRDFTSADTQSLWVIKGSYNFETRIGPIGTTLDGHRTKDKEINDCPVEVDR